MFKIKNHPFAIQAYFKSSVVITYAFPKEELSTLIPECLQLDTYNDQWAFLALAIVDARNLRIKGSPAFLGNNFILAGYRIFVRYTTKAGKKLRGLYILKSETNQRKMTFLGNIFSHYKYSTTDINIENKSDSEFITSHKSGLDIEILQNQGQTPLPDGSPFKNWKEARHFAGPLPFTFTYLRKTKEVLIVEGVRQDWIPRPVQIIRSNVDFISEKHLQGAVLANGFIIKEIPYHWKKGKIDLWKG